MIKLLWKIKISKIKKQLKKLEKHPIIKKEYIDDIQKIIIKSDCNLAEYEYEKIIELIKENLYAETELGIVVSRMIAYQLFKNQKTVAINEKPEETYEVLILSKVIHI